MRVVAIGLLAGVLVGIRRDQSNRLIQALFSAMLVSVKSAPFALLFSFSAFTARFNQVSFLQPIVRYKGNL